MGRNLVEKTTPVQNEAKSSGKVRMSQSGAESSESRGKRKKKREREREHWTIPEIRQNKLGSHS